MAVFLGRRIVPPPVTMPVGLNSRLTLIITLSLVVTLVACNKVFPLPSDARMEQTFHRSRSDFELLVKMLNEDPRLSAVRLESTALVSDGRWPRADVGLSQARWSEYRKLFKKLGLEIGIVRWSVPPNSIAFLADSRGMAVAGELKGYLYSPTEPPSPLVTSLDHGVPPGVPPPTPPHTAAVAFKEIDKNWYLFYMEE
jgi:hypothetical protein